MKTLAVLGALVFVFQPVFIAACFVVFGALEAMDVDVSAAFAAPVVIVLLAGAGAVTWAVLRAASQHWRRV